MFLLYNNVQLYYGSWKALRRKPLLVVRELVINIAVFSCPAIIIASLLHTINMYDSITVELQVLVDQQKLMLCAVGCLLSTYPVGISMYSTGQYKVKVSNSRYCCGSVLCALQFAYSSVHGSVHDTHS